MGMWAVEAGVCLDGVPARMCYDSMTRLGDFGSTEVGFARFFTHDTVHCTKTGTTPMASGLIWAWLQDLFG